MTSEQIFEQLGINDSSNEFKARILTKIMAMADLRFARVVDEVMTDEDRQEFEDFSKGREPRDIARWVEEKYEGIGGVYDAIVDAIVKELKNKNI